MSFRRKTPEKVNPPLFVPEDVSHWFELSYAQYLTIPRSVLEAMPEEWQKRFALCLAELDETIDWRPKEGRYWCRLRDGKGRFIKDEFENYRYPPKMPYIDP